MKIPRKLKKGLNHWRELVRMHFQHLRIQSLVDSVKAKCHEIKKGDIQTHCAGCGIEMKIEKPESKPVFHNLLCLLDWSKKNQSHA